MKRKFTFLMAAFMLLVFMMPSMVAWGQSFQLASSISVGDIVVITSTGTSGNNSFSKEMTGISTTSTPYGLATDFTNSPAGTYLLTIEAGSESDTYSFKTSDNKYLNWGSGNSLSLASNKGKSSSWSVSFSGNDATVVNANDNTRKLVYNSGSPRFACYTSAQKAIQLYKQSGSSSVVATPVITGSYDRYYFGESTTVTITCGTEGAAIQYSFDESSWTDYSDPFEITESKTVYAKATATGMTPSAVNKEFTKLEMKTIAEARTQGNGPVYTQGTVTSVVNNSAFIQDNDAAINVFGQSGLTVGTKYKVLGELSLYNGLLEITNPICTTTTGGTVIAPQVMTIAEINASSNQGWFIKIVGATVGSTTNGNTTLTQGENSIIARNIAGTFAENDVIDLTGNISIFNTTKQIANPIVVVAPTITVDENELTLTYQLGETTAPEETLIVEGSNLEGDITVEISGNGFKMSEDGSTWSTDAITLTPTNGTLNETMIGVQLVTGLNYGDYNGTITLTSTNAETITVTLTGHVTNQTYPITLNQTTGGTISSDPAGAAEANATVTLSYELSSGYVFGEWTVLDDQAVPVSVNNNQFTMPACKVEVGATFNQVDYTITIADTDHGTVEVSDNTAHYGDDIIVTVTPATGYCVQSFNVTETNGSGTVTEIDVANDLYSFDMPAFNITIAVVFEEIPVVYSGQGTFVKVTDLDKLEDGGYYMLVYDNHALKASYYGSTTNEMASSSVSTNSSNQIVDPAKDIVWKLEANADNWNLYNEDAGKYCYNKGTGSTGFSLGGTAEASYTVSLSDGTFIFQSTDGGRCIAYYGTNYSFRTYASSNSNAKLTLYKLGTERTITFDGNGGTYNNAQTYTQTVYNGIAANLNANQFMKANATFTGWNTESNGTGTPYADQAEVTLNADMTLYAQWESSHTLTLVSPNAEVLVFVDGNNDPIEFVNNEAQISDGLTLYASIDPYDCYTFESIVVTYGDNQTVTLNEEEPGVYYSFTMPSENATLTVTTTDNPTHTLTLGTLSNVTLALTTGDGSDEVVFTNNEATLCEGIHVTIIATPSDGYMMESVSVVDVNDQPVEVTSQGTNTDGDYVYSFEMPTSDATITASAIQAATYTLVTDASQIVSGKHYIIASGKEGTCRVIGAQAVTNNGSQGNNRTSVEATVTNNSITGTTGIYELVINGPETITINQEDVNVYTIYDAQYPGYLYAASSSSNHLKTRPANLDANSQWTIGIAATTSVATIKAQGGNSRNWMRNNSNIFACYSSGQSDIYLFVKDGDTDFEYYGSEITYTDNDIPDGTTITVGTGSVMTVDNNFENTDSDKLIIEDGGQLIHTADVNATMLKDITGYGDDNTVTTGWYTIASPVAAANIGIAAAGTYDLYKYDEKNVLWLNQELPENNTLFASFNQGVGYLYGNAAGVELQFAGEMVGTSTEITVPLSCSATNVNLQGFNLVGNPFTRNLVAGDVKILEAAMTSYYYVAGGSELSSALIGERPIKPGEGFFVQTSAAGNLVLNPSSKGSRGMDKLAYVRIEAGNDNHKDQAFIQIGQGNTLNKMTINDNVAHVSVQNNNAEYAVATIEEARGEMPVNFKAAENGTYTIDVEAENLEVNYLHLIDNLTGMDVDLLATPSYTFEVRKSDIASRFRLVFDANTGNDETNDNFAFINNGELIVNGNGTVQVIDILGHQMFSHEVNSAFRIQNSSFAPGVYVLRLINGNDVKTQKIVIK